MIVVNVTEVVPDKRRYRSPRTLRDSVTFQELLESIRKDGIIVPICVKKQRNGYKIIDGEYRYAAALELRITRIPVEVVQ